MQIFFHNSNAQITNLLSKNEKLYGLSKFWQEVNYNFVYIDKVDRSKWDSTYKSLLGTISETKNDYEYYRELQKFCALLNDGHTNIYMPNGFDPMITMFGAYRLFVEAIEHKAIIVRTNLSKKEEIPIGSEIIGVNGLSTKDYIAKYVAPYISSSTSHIRDILSINKLLAGLPGEGYQVRIRKPNGKIIDLDLEHKRTEEEAVFPPFITTTSELLEFKWFDNNIAYVALNSFGNPQIDTLFIQKLPELYKAKALVIDLRNNGGGSTDIGVEIFKYLTNDTLLYGSLNASRVHIPAFKAWGVNQKADDSIGDAFNAKSYKMFRDEYFENFDYEPDSNDVSVKKIVIPTVLLIGAATASAAEDFLIYADKQNHMIKIGTPTFGSTGQPFLFDMPGGGKARVCTKKDTYPDGREFVGVGILPDITVEVKQKDYFSMKDVVLEFAINHLKNVIKK